MRRRPGMGALLIVAVAALAGCGRAAGAPAARAVAELLSTDSLAARLARGETPTIVDMRPDVGAYLKSHLRGAVYLNAETLRASEGGVPNLLLPATSYAALFTRLGIRADHPVVIYSAGETRNFDATYLAWILAGAGHPAVRVLDGGFGKWELEARPTTRQYPRAPAGSFAPAAFTPERATLDDVRQALGRTDVVLVDARVPEQYRGEAGAQMRLGHIPGALSHYWQEDLVQGDFSRPWKPRPALEASYAAQGITPDKRIIVYCNGGLESSHVYFTLRALLGYPDVRVYDGSWTEWAAHGDLPVETGGPPARASVATQGTP